MRQAAARKACPHSLDVFHPAAAEVCILHLQRRAFTVSEHHIRKPGSVPVGPGEPATLEQAALHLQLGQIHPGQVRPHDLPAGERIAPGQRHIHQLLRPLRQLQPGRQRRLQQLVPFHGPFPPVAGGKGPSPLPPCFVHISSIIIHSSGWYNPLLAFLFAKANKPRRPPPMGRGPPGHFEWNYRLGSGRAQPCLRRSSTNAAALLSARPLRAATGQRLSPVWADAVPVGAAVADGAAVEPLPLWPP